MKKELLTIYPYLPYKLIFTKVGDGMSLSWIDEYVDGVIDHCYSNNIHEIYSTLNINIKRVDSNHKVLQGNEALYFRDYFGIELVFIRDDLPHSLEKYVLSHELGHAILHIEVNQAAYNSKLINKSKLEKQADYFAVKLLNIPIDNTSYGGFTTEQISNELCVADDTLIYEFEVIG